jgi:hypothetical protein
MDKITSRSTADNQRAKFLHDGIACDIFVLFLEIFRIGFNLSFFLQRAQGFIFDTAHDLLLSVMCIQCRY